MTELGPTGRMEVAHDAATRFAGEVEEVAGRLARRAARLTALIPVIGAVAPLSPATAVAAQVAMGAATTGPVGLASVAASLASTAGCVRQAVAALVGVDAALGFAMPAVSATIAAVPTTQGPIRDLAEVYAGTEGPATVLPGAPWGPVGAAPPHRLSGVLDRLAQVSGLPDGTIGIEAVTGADGVRRFVVYLPGTDSLDREAVRSWSTNASIRLGNPTTYQAGVMAAMTQAGIRPGEPVMLVGHSQGGMVAAEIARSPGAFTIAQVVSAGAPIGDRPPPARTGLIALEHRTDPVPHLDGAPLVETENHRTLRFSDLLGSPPTTHGLGPYVAGARLAERSTDPEVAGALAGVEPFVGGSPQASSTWMIGRADQ